MPRIGLCLLACVSLITPALAAAPKTWERGPDGQWQMVNEPAARVDVLDNPTLDAIEQTLSQGKGRSARKPIIRWIKANSAAPDRDRGLFLLAEMYYQTGDRVRAYYHLDELMETYPGSRLFYPSLEKQYAIADAYLNGYKRRLFKLAVLGAKDEAIEILFRIQERAPGSPVAERSLLRTADFYYDSSNFDLAADAYTAYVRGYPRSPEVTSGRVPLRQAFSSYAQFRGLQFDPTPVIDAKAQLEDVRAQYPDLAREENIGEVLERIDSTLAARVYETADFYRRTHEPRAQAFNLRYLVDTYPQTPEAAQARAELDRLPAWAQELPKPPGEPPAPAGPPVPTTSP